MSSRIRRRTQDRRFPPPHPRHSCAHHHVIPAHHPRHSHNTTTSFPQHNHIIPAALFVIPTPPRHSRSTPATIPAALFVIPTPPRHSRVGGNLSARAHSVHIAII